LVEKVGFEPVQMAIRH